MPNLKLGSCANQSSKENLIEISEGREAAPESGTTDTQSKRSSQRCQRPDGNPGGILAPNAKGLYEALLSVL